MRKCANRPATVIRNFVVQMIMWLGSGHITMLCQTYSERLVFHSCSETTPTEVPWFSLVLPDKCWVRVFLKWHKAGLANMRPSRKVLATSVA
jgi:hypothetical protein